MAFVALRPGARAEGFEARLQAFARERLAGFECPEWVRVVRELPVRLSRNAGRGLTGRWGAENEHGQDSEGRAAQGRAGACGGGGEGAREAVRAALCPGEDAALVRVCNSTVVYLQRAVEE